MSTFKLDAAERTRWRSMSERNEGAAITVSTATTKTTLMSSIAVKPAHRRAAGVRRTRSRAIQRLQHAGGACVAEPPATVSTIEVQAESETWDLPDTGVAVAVYPVPVGTVTA